MCDPVTALAIAGGVAGGAGSLFSGMAGERANKLNAEIARGNAETLLRQAGIEKMLADLPLLKGAFESGKVRRAGERVIGSQVAGFQSSGLDPASGSPLLVMASTAAQIEVDAGLIDAQAKLENASALSRVARTIGEASGAYGSAAGYAQRASDSLVAGVLGAASSILGAGAKAWPGLSTAAPAASGGGGFYATSGPPAQSFTGLW
jgi:hypothetical protein